MLEVYYDCYSPNSRVPGSAVTFNSSLQTVCDNIEIAYTVVVNGAAVMAAGVSEILL